MSGPVAHRVILYYQTQFSNDPDGVRRYISPLPLRNLCTHIIVGAIHMNPEGNDQPGSPVITLNDQPYNSDVLTAMWAELADLRESGMTVIGMLGGAAKGSYALLSQSKGTFDVYYPYLCAAIIETGIQGLDLDVEESVSLDDIVHLVRQLKEDFGDEFILTLAPVAPALTEPARWMPPSWGNLSGFSYFALEEAVGDSIAWYNAQFYCGWGPASEQAYDRIIQAGWWPRKVVLGTMANPLDGGGQSSQYIDVEGVLCPMVVRALARRYKGWFGGVSGWEYWRALPGGREEPWKWAICVKEAMRLGLEDR